MNKNLKKIIAVALTIGTVSAVAPATEYNFLATKAYASDDNDKSSLSKLRLETSSGSNIQLYESDSYKSSEKVDSDDVSEGETYYAKTTSSKINVSTSGVTSKYIRVFKGTSSSSKGYKTSNDISLSSGTNTITVKIYSEEPSGTPKLGDDDNEIGKYTIKVKCTSSGSSDDDDDSSSSQDSIYLSSISLSDGDIDFSKKTSSYNVTVGSSVDEISIKAKPEDEDYTVEINGSSVDEDDNWKKTIDLDKGKNKITITVEDDDDNKRTYTLNVTRGAASTTTDKIYLDTLKVGATSLTLSEDKMAYNLKFGSNTEKVQIYADPKDSDYTVTIDGTTVDDDDSYKKTVELKEDKVTTFKVKVKNSSGTEQVYTLNIGRGDVKSSDFPTINTGNNANGGQTDNTINNNANTNKWVVVNGYWQYNDAKGVALKNQWFYDSNYGKDYYLTENGNMQTGWLLYGGDWYYLGSDGAKKTGWQYDGSAWYYMDARGVMQKNTVIGGYRLLANGAWDWK